jgi:hypothetical protein
MLEAAGGSPRPQKRGQDSPHGPRPVTTTASLGRAPAAGASRDRRCPWSSGTGLPDHHARRPGRGLRGMRPEPAKTPRKHHDSRVCQIRSMTYTAKNAVFQGIQGFSAPPRRGGFGFGGLPDQHPWRPPSEHGPVSHGWGSRRSRLCRLLGDSPHTPAAVRASTGFLSRHRGILPGASSWVAVAPGPSQPR